MSVVVRYPDGQVKVLAKGADTTMIPLLREDTSQVCRRFLSGWSVKMRRPEKHGDISVEGIVGNPVSCPGSLHDAPCSLHDIVAINLPLAVRVLGSEVAAGSRNMAYTQWSRILMHWFIAVV